MDMLGFYAEQDLKRLWIGFRCIPDAKSHRIRCIESSTLSQITGSMIQWFMVLYVQVKAFIAFPRHNKNGLDFQFFIAWNMMPEAVDAQIPRLNFSG